MVTSTTPVQTAVQADVLKYPLSDEHGYKAAVFFQIVGEDPIDISNQVLEDVTPDGLFQIPTDRVADLKGTTRASNVSANPADYRQACILYLPAAIQISDAASYDGFELGALGATIEAGLKAGSGAGDVAFSALKAGAKSIMDGLSANMETDTGKLAVTRLISKMTSDDSRIEGAVKSRTRVTTNPNIRAIFSHVPLREFSFTFKMIAHNYTEAQEIKKIIKYFRTELYPEEIVLGVDGITASYGYQFPNKFRIEMYHSVTAQPITTKIKDCYLTSFNAVYNPTGAGLHADGNFTEVDITMSYREASALSRRDVDVDVDNGVGY